MKNFKPFRQVIKIFSQTCIDVMKYLIVWLIVLFLFTFFFIILGVQACEGEKCEDDHDDYKEVHKLMALFFQTLRNGVGDLNAPVYDWYVNLVTPKD